MNKRFAQWMGRRSKNAVVLRDRADRAPLAAPDFKVMAVAAGVALAALTSTLARAEDWKGATTPEEVTLGALAGLGVYQDHGGFSLLGTASKTILDHGFLPDFNNSAAIEVELGPLFIQGSTGFTYSAHLRWDFRRDDIWTFYALGGVAGNITGDALGDRFVLLPRFGIGAMATITSGVRIRGELSHELIALGVNFAVL